MSPHLDVCWHRFHNARVDTYSSFVAVGSNVYLQHGLASLIADGADFSAGFVTHNGLRASLVMDDEARLDRGIAIFGLGAFNWYHWIVEVLPKALLAQHLPDKFSGWPLLVPSIARQIPTFEAALRRCSGGRPIRYVERGPVSVDDLIWIDTPAISPFNMANGWPSSEQSYHHVGTLSEVSRVLGSGGFNPVDLTTESPKRILLTRSDERRSYNQDDVVEMAKAYGFEPVAPENLSLDEQVALFQNLEFVIGPSGAAWTGLLFARSGTRGLIWAPQEYRWFNAFANLAHQSRAELRYQTFPLNVATTGEAYNASYELDVPQLQENLEKLLSQ